MLLLLGSEVAFVGHNFFCVVWMLYVVSGTQVKVGGVFLVSLQRMVHPLLQILKQITFPSAPVMLVLFAEWVPSLISLQY